MTLEKITSFDDQLRTLVASVNALQDHGPYWKHFLISAVPIFLASLLGLTTALFLDWLKTRRENLNSVRLRLETELALLSGVNTAIAFNISALIHTISQQILPHYEKSNAALKALDRCGGSQYRFERFERRLHSEFHPMMTRCPIPYFEELNLSKDLPFLIAKDPDLIMTSGWIMTYVRNLKIILDNRNKLIDKATIENPNGDGDLPRVRWQIEAQANISKAEIINSYQLIVKLREASHKIENIIRTEYNNVIGPKLKIEPPEFFADLINNLDRISRTIITDLPPP